MAREKLSDKEKAKREQERKDVYEARKAKLETMTIEEKTAYLHGEKVDRFRGVAPPRIQNVMDALGVLEHCANTASYAYNEAQVQEMTDTLTLALENTLAVFRPKSAESEKDFAFSK